MKNNFKKAVLIKTIVAFVLLFTANVVNAQVQLYGVTQSGGGIGAGALFKYESTTDSIILKHNFSPSGLNNPIGKLLYASNGKIYGTTVVGGSAGGGGIFEYDPTTEIFIEKVLFDYFPTGNYSYGSLIELGNGDIVGTCTNGGDYGAGTIWKYNILSNTITKLHDFNAGNFIAGTSGSFPYSGVTLASNGKLYGMTTYGGEHGMGTFYECDPITNAFRIILPFSYWDGAYSYGKLTAFNDKIYGATTRGGFPGMGTIFEYDVITSTFTTKASFSSTTGELPMVGMTLATNGLFYGTTNGGGNFGGGILYSFDPTSGIINKLLDFDHTFDGTQTNSLLQASDGNLYWMVSTGFNNFGSIYKYNIATNSVDNIHDFSYYSTGAYPIFTELTELVPRETGKKVTICHNSGNGKTQTITISKSALNAHLAHGDKIGACPSNNNKKSLEENNTTEENNSVNIYPNPSSGNFNVSINSSELVTLTVTELTGQTILQTTSQNLGGSVQIPVDLTAFSSGVYFVKIQTGQEIITQKVIVNK